MQAMLCDACQQPMTGAAYEVALLRGTVVSNVGELACLAATEGVLSATLCTPRCGERLGAIVKRKLEGPCPTCEVAPLREADAPHDLRYAV